MAANHDNGGGGEFVCDCVDHGCPGQHHYMTCAGRVPDSRHCTGTPGETVRIPRSRGQGVAVIIIPPALLPQLVYDPNFAIRGLHYDVANGLFLKVCESLHLVLLLLLLPDPSPPLLQVDSAHHIQLGTVHRGK